MKKRLKGLVCWWLALVMLFSTLATPAMALPSTGIYIYTGTEPLKANDELDPYVRKGVSEGTQLSSLVPLGDGVTLTGWNLWEFANINSGYVITDKLLTKDTDWTLSANDVENYANGGYYAFEPIYSGQIAIYTDADEVAADKFVGDYEVVSAKTDKALSEQAEVMNVLDSSKSLESWDVWSAGWSDYHSGTVWNERISEESADYTPSAMDLENLGSGDYYLVPVYGAAPPHVCQWSYSIKTDQTDIIVATCNGEGECTSTVNKELTVIAPAHAKVNDSKEAAATLSATSIGGISELPDIVYYKYSQYPNIDEDSATTIPFENLGGRFKAEITVGGVTAYTNYMIERLDRASIKQFAVSNVTVNSFVITLDEADRSKTDFVCQFGSETIEFTPDANGKATITVPQAYEGSNNLWVYVYQKQTDIYKKSNTKDTTVSLKNPEYTVIFNANGGSGTMANQTITLGEATALSENIFTKTGYTFEGWATTAAGTKVYNDKQSVSDLTNAGESITLFAVWNKIPANAPAITFQPQGFEDANALTYANIGTDKKLSVETYADENEYIVTYQWYKNTTNSKDGAVAIGTEKDLAIENGLNAGDYYYYCKITVTRKDNGESTSVDTDLVKVTVNKATVAVPTAASKVYTGSTLKADISETADYTVTTNNGGITVGQYDVVLNLKDSANYKWSDGTETAAKTIKFEIKKATPSLEAPTAQNDITYGVILSTVGLSDGWTWLDGTAVPTVQNSGFVAYFTPADTANYDWTGIVGWNEAESRVEKTVSVTVTKADSSIAAAPTAILNLEYDGSAKALVNAGTANGGTMQYSLDGTTWSADIPAGTNANTYTVYYKVVGDANHDDNAGGSVSVTIGKADKTAPEVAGVDETIKSKADGRITGVDDTMEYKKQGDANYIAITADTVENLAAGTYLVRYKETENYFASSDKQIVIADGVMLTIAFNSNDGTSVDSVTCEWNQTITAPTEPTKENFVFAGWYKDAGCFDLWNFSNTLTEDITLYAKWNDKPVYTINGRVTDGESGLGGITVTLKQGNTIIATTTTAADGSYSFITEDGLYNIVAEKKENDNSTIKTVKIEVIESANVNDVVFVATDINSELEIMYDTPQIIVGGLDEEAKTVSSSYGHADVTVKMTVESTKDITGSDDATGQEQRQTEQKEIKKVSGNRYIQFIEINLTKSISGAESTKLEVTSGLIEIIIPFEKGNKRNITVYRYHGSVAEKLGAGIGNTNADDEYFEVKENHIVVYAKKFSTYAIGYDLPSSGGGGSSVTRYTVKFDTNGGSSVSSATVTKNAKVAEPKTPEKDGYTFGGWYTDKEFAEKYDFESKVTKNFTLYAKWDKHDDEQSSTDTHNCPSLAFDDLDITKWYHFDTDYVIENGIFKGTTETTFEPDSAQTRAMMVTVLYRVEGEPATNRSIPFADVDMGAYYANAVIWGQQNGIIKGYSETEFGPDDKITREQIAAIMHRYAQYKGYDVSVGENTNILSYEDFDEISDYAIPSMQWAVGSGMIKGKSESTLNPLDNATRAEIAAILHRFIEANLISTQN